MPTYYETAACFHTQSNRNFPVTGSVIHVEFLRVLFLVFYIFIYFNDIYGHLVAVEQPFSVGLNDVC